MPSLGKWIHCGATYNLNVYIFDTDDTIKPICITVLYCLFLYRLGVFNAALSFYFSCMLTGFNEEFLVILGKDVLQYRQTVNVKLMNNISISLKSKPFGNRREMSMYSDIYGRVRRSLS